MNKMEPYFLDDNVVIPKSIKEITKQELEQEIKRLEKKASMINALADKCD
jgi:hypothetical protein